MKAKSFGDYKIRVMSEGVRVDYEPEWVSGEPDHSYPVGYVGTIYHKEDFPGWRKIFVPLALINNWYLDRHILNVIRKDIGKSVKSQILSNRKTRLRIENEQDQATCPHDWLEQVARSDDHKSFKCKRCGKILSYLDEDVCPS